MDEKQVIKRIFLVRHGRSAGNDDVSLYKKLADPLIPLTEEGKKQAFDAGIALGTYITEKITRLEPGIEFEHFRIWNSSYRRTRETSDELLKGILNVHHNFTYDRREDDRLVEQNFGLFDGLTDEEKATEFPREWAYYNRMFEQGAGYWARPPLGESRAEVCERVNQFKETIWRDAPRVQNLIIVSHGVTVRAFCKNFLNLPYEWFENEKNPDNCSIQFIEYNKAMNNYKPQKYIYSLKEPTPNPVKPSRKDFTP